MCVCGGGSSDVCTAGRVRKNKSTEEEERRMSRHDDVFTHRNAEFAQLLLVEVEEHHAINLVLLDHRGILPKALA